MPYEADPLSERLDKVATTIAGAVGLTRLQRRFKSGRAFRFRFTPVVLLALAAAGLWAQIARPELPGFLLVMVVWMTSGAIQSFSPIGNLRGGQLDEREASLVRSGHSAGLLAAVAVAVLGCLLIGMGSTAEMARLGEFWAPETGTEWFAIAFFLLAVEANVATMAASAKLPPALEDEEDE